MIFLKVMALIVCAVLWRLGGTNKKSWCRDLIIPIILGIYIGIQYHWIVGFFTIGSFQIIRLGYGAYDPEHDDKPSLLAKITHDREGWINRAVVGLLYGVIGLIPLFIYWLHWGLVTNNFLMRWFMYCNLNLIIGGVFCKLKTRDVFIEPAIGAGVGSLLFIF